MLPVLRAGFVLDQRLETDTEPVMWLGLCELRLMNDRRWPWLVLVPQRPGVEEIHDLTPLDQAMLTFETNMVAQALKKMTGCSKINSGALGNIVRQAAYPYRRPLGGRSGLAGTGMGLRLARTLPARRHASIRRSDPSRAIASPQFHLTDGSPMTFALFDAPLREASQFVGYAENTIDRQSEKRSDDSIGKGACRSGCPADADARRAHPAQVARRRLRPLFPARRKQRRSRPAFDQAVLLGQSAHGPVLAVPAGVEPEALPETVKAIDYRSVNVQGLIDAPALGALAQGAALLAWHANHGFCGKCGGPHRDACRRLQAASASTAAPSISRAPIPVAIMLAVTQRALPARPQPAFHSRHVFRAGRLHRARRDDRGRGAARDAGGVRHQARPRRLSCQPALAVSLFADDRLLRRGAQRGHQLRRDRARGLPLVLPRRGARHARRRQVASASSCRRRRRSRTI